MLSVTNKPFMLSFALLNVVMLSVVVPYHFVNFLFRQPPKIGRNLLALK
jgi:hypothetical protein